MFPAFAIRSWLANIEGLQDYFVTGKPFRSRQSCDPVPVFPNPVGRSNTASTTAVSDDDIPTLPVGLQYSRCESPLLINQPPAAHLDSNGELEYPTDVLEQVKTEDSECVFDLISADTEVAKRIAHLIDTLPCNSVGSTGHGAGESVLRYPLSPLLDGAGAGTQFQTQSTVTPYTLSTNAPTDSGFESTREQSGQGGFNSGPSRKRQKNSDNNGTPRKRKNQGDSGTLTEAPKPAFACPFHIFMPNRFCKQHNIDRIEPFSTCAGPGWKEIRHLKDHIKRVHMHLHCRRCWQTFDSEPDWENHVYLLDPRCEDRRADVNQLRFVTPAVFDLVEQAVSVKKSEGAVNPTEWERWYKVKNLIFPPTRYPHFPDPPHPYYKDPNGNDTVPEFQQHSQAQHRLYLKSLMDARLQVVQATDPHATLSSDEMIECSIEAWNYMDRKRAGGANNRYDALPPREENFTAGAVGPPLDQGTASPGPPAQDSTDLELRRLLDPVLREIT